MLFQYAIQVNSVEDDSRPQPNRTEQGAEVFVEGPALDAQVMQCLLAIEAALIHRFPSDKPAPVPPLPPLCASPPARDH